MRKLLQAKALLLCAALLSASIPAAFAAPKTPTTADAVKRGVDAWSAGQYEAAVKLWQAAAATGDPDAQFNLGQAYKLGKGVPKSDLARAEELYRQAAEQGHIQAADNYGLLLFQTGKREQAMGWLVPSAERGEARAQYVLGIAYFNGDLVARDPVRGYALMTRAAAVGLDQAKGALEKMDAVLPIEQRREGVALAAKLEQQALARRNVQFSAADLGPAPSPGREKSAAPAKARPAPLPLKSATTPPLATAKAAVSLIGAGPWRAQIGAFAVAANADALWNRVRTRPALAGAERYLVPSGRVTRLLVGPFPSEAAALRACATLGSPCLALRR